MAKIDKNFKIDLPKDLFDKITARIIKEKQMVAFKRKILFFFSIFVVSLVAIIPVFNAIKTELVKSGFIQFLSLLASDFPIVALYWKSFVFTILETLPAIKLSVLLLIFLAFLQSSKYLVKYIKIVYFIS